MLYLPIEKELCKLPKQFVVNVIYATNGDDFAAFIKVMCEERNHEIIEKRQMLINVDP